MATTLEAVEALIVEADGRFAEKLRCAQQNIPTNYGVYSDRSYSIRQVVASDPILMGDSHFLTLLNEIEIRLASDTATLGVGVDKKLEEVAAGLLKTLIRESMSLPSSSLRKIAMDMIYHWHADKQKDVLSVMLAHLAPSRTASIPTAGVSPEPDAPRAEKSSPKKAPLPRPASAPQSRFAQRLMADRNREAYDGMPTLTFAQEAAKVLDHAAITRRLCHYSRRNLSMAEEVRKREAQGVKVVYSVEAEQRRQKTLAERFDKPIGPSGPKPLLHRRYDAPIVAETYDAAVKAEEEMRVAIDKAERRILHHVTQKVEETMFQRALDDVSVSLCFNQARMDEEIQRRSESNTYLAGVDIPRAVPVRRPSTASAAEQVRRALKHRTYDGPDVTLSAHDLRKATKREEAAAQAVVEVRGGGELDVQLSPRCVITPAIPRIDTPIAEQLFAPPAAAVEVHADTIKELRTVERMREICAAQRTADGKSVYMPRSALKRSFVKPRDAPTDMCRYLLPSPADAFPRNPNPVEPKKRRGRRQRV